MKPLLLATLVLLVAAPAAAQTLPPGPQQVVPRLPADARAQGITVTGSATSKVTATWARVTMNLFARNNAGAFTDATLAPVIDALTQAGIDRSNVRVSLGASIPGGAPNATIEAIAEKPDPSLAMRAVPSIASAIERIPGAAVQNAQVELRRTGCESEIEAVRREAIANARSKAESAARDLGVRVGAVLAYQSNDGNAAGTCFANENYGSYTPFPADPQELISFSVNSYVTITYAIR